MLNPIVAFQLNSDKAREYANGSADFYAIHRGLLLFCSIRIQNLSHINRDPIENGSDDS